MKINDYVHIINSNIYGKIIYISNTKIIIKTDDYKTISTNKNNVEPSKTLPSKKVKINISFPKPQLDSKNEIMLRHLTKEEALIQLELFISKCLVNKIFSIKIIHGKNGGILRNAVHEYLKTSPYIQEFHLAGYFEGQYGVTIATLKQ